MPRRVGSALRAGWGRGFCARCLRPPFPGPPGPLARGGRARVSPRSPAGNCPGALPPSSSSRRLAGPLLPARALSSLLFPSPGRRRLLLLLPFSLDLSLPARNPFRPGSRSGQAAVCPNPWPSGGRSSGASVCRCVRLPAGPGERPPALRRPPVPARVREPPPGDHPGVGSPGRGGSWPPPPTTTPPG